MSQPFLLFDGNALLHRGYHALPDLKTSHGHPTGATFGFCSTFLTVIQEFKPQYVAVAFDRQEPTFRKELYSLYKAHRVRMDEELALQIADVRMAVEAFGCSFYEMAGYEADDIIGTLVSRIHNEVREQEVIIVTGDLDALQLVDEYTKVYTLRKGVTDSVMYTQEAVMARFHFPASSLIDYKALCGDASDNIPGVRGIGEKTATELISIHITIEALYENLERDPLIKRRVKDLLIQGREDAFLSKKLATIVRDVPITFCKEDCSFSIENFVEVAPYFFDTFEFTSLSKRLRQFVKLSPRDEKGQKQHPSSPVIVPSSSLHSSVKKYILVANSEQFDLFLKNLLSVCEFAFDTETSSQQPLTCDLIGISFSWEKDVAWYIAFNAFSSEQQAMMLKQLQSIFEDPTVEKYGHNMKFDCEVLARRGIHVTPLSFDTMLAAYILAPGESVSLKRLAYEKLGVTMKSIEEFIGKGRQQKSFAEVPYEEAAEYSCADADVTRQLVIFFKDAYSSSLQ